jgi:2-dehydropantoate 2-reductase
MVAADPARVGPVDAVLVTVKAWHLADAARAMRPLIATTTRVLPFQNGVEAIDTLAEIVGPRHVLGAICRIICLLEGPGRVRHVALEPTIDLGEPAGGELSESGDKVANALDRAGFRVQRRTDIRAALWEKLVFLAAVSGVGAVARCPIADIRACGASRALLGNLMTEVMTVAKGRGVLLPPDIVHRTMEFIDAMAPESTTSMQRDVMAGRPSELEAVLGVVSRLGRETATPTPAVDAIYGSLVPQEFRARGQVP